MKTKRVSWLLAITCLLPWVAWAEGDNNTEGLTSVATTDRCQATFSVSDQTLTIPCVEVVMGNEPVLYSAQLQQVAEGNFALTQVAELSAAVESECVASYSLETGELGVPCVEEVNPPEVADMRALVFYAEEPGAPSVFVVGEPGERQGVRAGGVCDAQATDKKWRNYCTRKNPYYPVYGGQCTSYAWGRAYERTGVQLSLNGKYPSAKYWLDGTISDSATGKMLTTGRTIQPDSIAVWNGDSSNPNGHVAYVERVVNGIVYFTEANVVTFISKWDVYGGGYDGYEKNKTVSQFESRIGTIKGYIYLSSPLKLDSNITMTPNPAIPGKSVTITAKISNREGTKDFRGNLYAAFHAQGNTMNSLFEIKLPDQPLGVGKDYTYTFGTAALNLAPGTYDLYIKGDDARALSTTASYLQNPLTVRVDPPFRLTLPSSATITPNPIIRGAKVTVQVNITNTGSQAFTGSIAAALHDSAGKFVGDIQLLNNQSVASGRTVSYTFTKPTIVSGHGSYRVQIKYSPDAYPNSNSAWSMLGETSVQIK